MPRSTSRRSAPAASSSVASAISRSDRSMRTASAGHSSAAATDATASVGWPRTRIRQSRVRRPAIAAPTSTELPSRRNTASSMTSSSSASTWLDTSTVRPSAANRRSRCRSSTRAAGSSPDAGSSSRSTRGSCTSARASPRRCFCPRESTRAGAVASEVSSTSSRSSSARALAASFGRSCSRPVTISVSRADSAPQVPRESGIQPRSARAAWGCSIGSTSPMRIVPASGVSSEASMRNSVVLPEPLGPTRPVTAPARARNETSRTASTLPNERRKPVATMPVATAPVGSVAASMVPPYARLSAPRGPRRHDGNRQPSAPAAGLAGGRVRRARVPPEGPGSSSIEMPFASARFRAIERPSPTPGTACSRAKSVR